MTPHITPMIHVPDIAATVAFYTSIGFDLVSQNEDNGCLDWAMVRLGQSAVMFSAPGVASAAERREVDLYIHVEGLEPWFAGAAPLAEVVEGLHTTFYGAREFIVRDVNRFWIPFGEPISKP